MLSLNNNLFDNVSLNKCVSGSIVYKPKGTFGPRIQPDYQMIVIKKGNLLLNLNGKNIQISPKENILLPPGNQEFFQFDKNDETEHSWLSLNFDPQSANIIHHELGDSVVKPHMPELEKIIDLILYIHEKNSELEHTVKKLSLAALSLFFPIKKKSDHHKNDPLWMDRVLNHIQQRFHDNNLTIDDLSKTAGISSGHFIREFKKYRKISPAKYLWQFRKEKALNLLLNSGWKVYDIADKTGFESVYHFSRVIKEYTGLSPLNYRKKQWDKS